MSPRLLLCSALLASGIAAYTQPFSWQWSAQTAAGATVPDIRSTATDAAGNTYLTGAFTGTATFGTLAPLVSAGGTDVFVAKVDNAGNVLWAVRAGGTTDDGANAIDVDNSGHAFLTGQFWSPTADFGATTLTRLGRMDIFCARIDGDGDFAWTKRFGGQDFSSEHVEQGNGLACDADGNVYLTGCFVTGLEVPGLPLLEDCSWSYFSSFLLKLDTDGNGIWSRRPECGHDMTYGASEGQRVAVNEAGDVYLGFRYRGDTCFVGGDTLLPGIFTRATFDAVFVRYDADGGYHWARRITAGGYDDVEAMAVDTEGACYVATHREGSYNLPNGVYVDYSGSFGYYKNALLKMSPEGDFVWGYRIGNSSYDHGVTGFKLDGLGQLLVGGWYDGHFNLGEEEPLPNTFGFSGFYVARFDTSSALLDVYASRHSLSKEVRGLGLDANRNIYIAGFFMDTLAFPELPTLEAPQALFLARSGDIGTGLSGPTEEERPTAYPVPNTGTFTVRNDRPFDGLRIEDALGRCVLDERFPSTTRRDLHLDADGVFFYTVFEAGRRAASGRLVVQR